MFLIGIQGTEVLHHSLSSVFLFHQKNWTVVPSSRRLNNPQSQPFLNLLLLQVMLIGLGNLVLLYIDQLLSFHKELMQNGIAVSDIVFIETEDLPMLS
jgi:hypothetical protein